MGLRGYSSDGKAIWSDGKPLTAMMDNVLASRMGHVFKKIQQNGHAGVGDSIDAGLILRRMLEEEGFHVVEISALENRGID
ncbi:MAG: hypothetical protein CMH23_07670 [Methylophaga sp.]|mgnify:CR=1 FL=1|nr:hypothetical protein [Methylophaga sp.]|tara:strand:+ start:70020 stop:70262 length:243 start_codon:yes stop_codon:yes gene_type:complete